MHSAQTTLQTMNLYPSIIHQGDLSPDSFGSDVDNICNEIHGACKGFGTDEKLVRKIGAFAVTGGLSFGRTNIFSLPLLIIADVS